MKRKNLEADVLTWWVRQQHEQKSVEHPLRRRQPKVQRMMSARQRKASSQTINTIRAIYSAESKWNLTPTATDEKILTRDVGPNDFGPNSASGSKATGTVTGAYRYDRPERRGQIKRTQNTKNRTKADWSAFADQYEI
jgi:hypothetical protein